MANDTFRAFPVFYRGKKIAEARQNTYEPMPNRTKMVGADGILGYSKGIVETKLQIDTVVPWTGQSVTSLEDLLSQEDVDIGIPIPGGSGLGFHTITMAITAGSFKSDAEKGTLEGSVTFEGGTPNVKAFA